MDAVAEAGDRLAPAVLRIERSAVREEPGGTRGERRCSPAASGERSLTSRV